MSFIKKIKTIPGSWSFLMIVFLTYLILYFLNFDLFYSSLLFSYQIVIKIIPIFLVVIVLIIISNYFITPKFITKHLKNKGIKKWIFVIIGGILSSGPIYLWYPLLADLKNKGLSCGLIACFIYNRATKIPLLPIAIFYFGWIYILILTLIMILMSIIQGILINKIINN